MDIYVGGRNVTSQFNSFFTQDGVTLDGNFNGNKETQAYTQALTYLRNALKNAVPSEGVGGQSRAEVRAAIDTRFEAYIDMIKSEGCEGKFEAIPVLQGLYEELTAFIESDAFEDVPAAKQQLIIGLQAEVFSRLEQKGTHRGVLPQDEEGTGTSAELAAFNPVSEDFAAHPEVIENVLDAAPMITWDNPACPVDAGDASADGTLNIYGSEGNKPQPFTGAAVNTDFRYGLHDRPASTSTAPAAGQKAAAESEKIDLVDLTDPLAGI
jgi:hypothetical protein